tara:strand:+ start:279 stop:476 length:198 start_codon:yes stop_codon:yes gene_type:complete
MDVDETIKDMDIHDTIEDMVQEGIEQGLIEVKGQQGGRPTYGLTTKGRRMVEVSNLRPFLAVADV